MAIPYTNTGFDDINTELGRSSSAPLALGEYSARQFLDASINRFQGTVSGYSSGGFVPGETPSYKDVIDKFPFASNANATDVGDLSQERNGVTGQSSTVSGYSSGGLYLIPPSTFTRVDIIDKFPFATDTNATDVGNLTVSRAEGTGQSSTVSGYTSGGIGPPISNVIDKFPFATNANATDVGDLTQLRYQLAGQSSAVSGYASGGDDPAPGNVNTIDKFPFATNANATDVGDLSQARDNVTGQSSTVSGYTSGGIGPPISNVIDKFPFATDANATDVGDLSLARSDVTGQSSTVSGYTSGGPSGSNVIDKFPFATDTNATDVGDLTQGRQSLAGQQD